MTETKELTITHLDIVKTEIVNAANQVRPVELGDPEIQALRSELNQSGVKTELSERERASLAESQFRLRYDPANGVVEAYDSGQSKGEKWVTYESNGSGRVVGVEAAMSPRTPKLVKWSYEKGKEHEWPRIGKAKHEGTRGRGIQQMAADVLQLASLDTENPAYETNKQRVLRKMNRRLWRGHDRMLKRNGADPEDFQKLDATFGEVCGEKPPRFTASCPPEVLPEIVDYLLSESD